MAGRTHPSDLVPALEAGTRIVYVHGDAGVLVDRAAGSAESWGLERCGLAAFNHGRWRASDDDAEQALTTARTVPMMADLRVVLLRDLHLAREPLATAVLDYMAEPSPSTLLILTAGPFGKVKKGGKNWSRRFSDAARKAGFHLSIKASDISPVRFAHEHAASLGLHLGRREADLLVELVGDDLGRLTREVEKLAVFLDARPGGEPVRVHGDALTEVCSALAEESVWELTTGLARQDRDLALRALHRLLSDGQDPHYLFAMVCMQLRKVLQAVQLLRRGVPEGVIKKKVRLWREMNDVRRLARASTDPGHPFHEPAVVFERLAAANRAMNSSGAGRHKILEALVVGLCAGI